jgi:hypothetical protein
MVAVEGCKMEIVGRMKENIPPPRSGFIMQDQALIHLPVWSNLVEFVAINCCNVRTCRSAVTVAPLFKNYTNKTPALSHKTLAVALSAQVRTFESGTQFVFRTGTYNLHSSVFAN